MYNLNYDFKDVLTFVNGERPYIFLSAVSLQDVGDHDMNGMRGGTVE